MQVWDILMSRTSCLNSAFISERRQEYLTNLSLPNLSLSLSPFLLPHRTMAHIFCVSDSYNAVSLLLSFRQRRNVEVSISATVQMQLGMS